MHWEILPLSKGVPIVGLATARVPFPRDYARSFTVLFSMCTQHIIISAVIFFLLADPGRGALEGSLEEGTDVC